MCSRGDMKGNEMFTKEKKFLSLANIEFVETPTYLNYRCPICGDSHKNKFKKRGYALKKNAHESAVFVCHNCSYSNSFYSMLQAVDLKLASEYLQEIKGNKKKEFMNRKNELDVFTKTEPKKIEEKKLEIPDNVEIYSDPYKVTSLTDEAKSYLLEQRCLDESDLKHFYSIPKLNAIIVFLTYKGNLIGYQVRWITQKRFFNHVNEDAPKIWNLDIVDDKKDIYIFESIFDALSSGIENSVAALGSSYPNPTKNLIFCMDNDKTGIEKGIKYSALGCKILVHNEQFPFKDFNEALVAGVSKEKLSKYINANVLCARLANKKLRLLR